MFFDRLSHEMLYSHTVCAREAAERRLLYSGLRPAGHSPEDRTGTLSAAVRSHE